MSEYFPSLTHNVSKVFQRKAANTPFVNEVQSVKGRLLCCGNGIRYSIAVPFSPLWYLICSVLQAVKVFFTFLSTVFLWNGYKNLLARTLRLIDLTVNIPIAPLMNILMVGKSVLGMIHPGIYYRKSHECLYNERNASRSEVVRNQMGEILQIQLPAVKPIKNNPFDKPHPLNLTVDIQNINKAPPSFNTEEISGTLGGIEFNNLSNYFELCSNDKQALLIRFLGIIDNLNQGYFVGGIIGLTLDNFRIYAEYITFYLKIIVHGFETNSSIPDIAKIKVLESIAEASEKCMPRWQIECKRQALAVQIFTTDSKPAEFLELEISILQWIQTLKQEIFFEYLATKSHVNEYNRILAYLGDELGLDSTLSCLDQFSGISNDPIVRLQEQQKYLTILLSRYQVQPIINYVREQLENEEENGDVKASFRRSIGEAMKAYYEGDDEEFESCFVDNDAAEGTYVKLTDKGIGALLCYCKIFTERAILQLH